MVYLIMIVQLVALNHSPAIHITIPFSGNTAVQVCEKRKSTLVERYTIKGAKVFDAYCIENT